MFGFEGPEDGSEERFLDDALRWRRRVLGTTFHRFWWVVHNCVAHPLIGVWPARKLFELHDFTARRLHDKRNGKGAKEAGMIEEWLEALGAKILVTIHADGHAGLAQWGPNRERSEDEPAWPAMRPALRLRYTWTDIDIGWEATFDRWANSTDWEAEVPKTMEGLSRILMEALRRGDAGDLDSAEAARDARIVCEAAKR